MKNLELSEIFYQMAGYMEMDDVEFKSRAYEKAARAIESLSDDISDVYKENSRSGLKKISGVGEGIADKIEEFIKTGKIKEYEDLKKKCPVDLEALSAIEGLGPKSIKVLYKNLKIKTLADLERAAKAGRIQKLEHFGIKSGKNILRGIEFLKKDQGRTLLGSIYPFVKKIEQRLKNVKGVSKAIVCGSFRRHQDTVGDIDILATAQDYEKISDIFCAMPEVKKVLAKGDTKSMVKLMNGLDADLRIVEEKSFGAASQYFTGSKYHNVALRKIAQEKGLKLNEYGLWRGKKMVAGKNENEIYEALGLKYIEPELREMRGEIEASRDGILPELVELKDIKGDLQVHSIWSDGAYSIKEMAEEAIKLGYEYIAITDHIGHLAIAGAMSEPEIKKQWEEIDKLNKHYGGKFKILKGGEVDINADGFLACSEKLLAEFDVVLASLHSQFKMQKDEMTKRVVRAMENPHVDIIAHPTTRVIGKRDEVEFDWEKIFKVAKKTGAILEINVNPGRSDLSDYHIKQAVEHSVLVSLGTDAHAKESLNNMKFGVFQARRGWASREDIVNCLGTDKLLSLS